MKTHRELREYDKMKLILKMLGPMIVAREAADSVDNANLTHKVTQEQADMAKVHEERHPTMFASSRYSSKNKGRKPKFTTEMEVALDI